MIFLRTLLALCVFIGMFATPRIHGEQFVDGTPATHEELMVEKRNLEKLQTQLQILESQRDEETPTQHTEPHEDDEQDTGENEEKTPIVISPNENIVLTKEVGEYGVPVYSVEAIQVKVSDILQALSASFGKSIIVDDDVDTSAVSSFMSVSIQKSPLQDILEVVLGTRGLEFMQSEDSIFVTALAKLNITTAYDYFRDKGVALYQKAQIKYPDDHRVAKAYFELGNYYYDMGFNFLAMQEFQAIIGKFRDSPLAKEALFKMGNCYAKLKDAEGARRAYFQFIYSYPKDTLVGDALLLIGDSMTEQGFFEKAIDIYERVIREYPNEVIADKAHFNVANTYTKMGNYRKALQYLFLAREKYRLAHVRPEIEYQIGNCLYLLKEYQDAGNVLGNLLINVQEGEFVENALFLLGDCFHKQGNYMAAYQVYKKAVETYPQSNKAPYGVYAMGQCLNDMGLPDSAIKTFREGMQVYAEGEYAGKMALEIGRCYFGKGDYWLAYNAFDSFTRQYPDSELITEVLIGMGDALFQDKKYTEAVDSYLKLTKTSEDEEVKKYAYKRIGDCYKRMGRIEDSIKAYQESLEKGGAVIQNLKQNKDEPSGAAKLAFEMGKNYFDKGEYRLAYNTFDSFVKQFPDSELVTDGMVGMADALYHDKKFEEAIESYNKLIEGTDKKEIRKHALNRIGDCYKIMGKLEEAAKAYKMSLDEDKSVLSNEPRANSSKDTVKQ